MSTPKDEYESLFVPPDSKVARDGVASHWRGLEKMLLSPERSDVSEPERGRLDVGRWERVDRCAALTGDGSRPG